MTDLYLIAHKVRGEPAFDIAEQMVCPECASHLDANGPWSCLECDGLGYWWIIPTSGHRAYPYWHEELDEIFMGNRQDIVRKYNCGTPKMPEGIPDHYITSAAPKPKLDIRALFRKAIPQTFIRRRL